ncbi:hypothetical protein BKK79_06675 [Cupriavidus sp. USMAA2-4]|nr:hypothetical protein BKK79_06675 [Cupriavidus sp. USMAA2-4]
MLDLDWLPDLPLDWLIQTTLLQAKSAVSKYCKLERRSFQLLRHIEQRDLDRFSSPSKAAKPEQPRLRKALGAICNPPTDQRKILRLGIDIKLQAIYRFTDDHSRLEDLHLRRSLCLDIKQTRHIPEETFCIARRVFYLHENIGLVDRASQKCICRAQQHHSERDPGNQHSICDQHI